MRCFLGVAVAAIVLVLPATLVAGDDTGRVNVYSHRHYDVDLELYERFEQQTGIKVNLVEGGSDELIERLTREGAESPADILMTVDAGRLHRAKQAGLLRPIASPTLTALIPEHLRDPDGHWFGLTQRARVIVYHPDRVDPAELSSYEELTDPRWQGRILIRSSSNIYNQSLLASMIANHGEDFAHDWAAGIVKNFARTPKGNDRAQMTAVAAGAGDIAIVNTYYVGRMLNSSADAEREVGAQMRVFLPNQDGRGAHVNVSGAGITASSKNPDGALRLLEFLVSEEAQRVWAQVNYEYPVNANVDPAPLLQSWGELKADSLGLHLLGEHNTAAVKIFDRVGWR